MKTILWTIIRLRSHNNNQDKSKSTQIVNVLQHWEGVWWFWGYTSRLKHVQSLRFLQDYNTILCQAMEHQWFIEACELRCFLRICDRPPLKFCDTIISSSVLGSLTQRSGTDPAEPAPGSIVIRIQGADPRPPKTPARNVAPDEELRRTEKNWEELRAHC